VLDRSRLALLSWAALCFALFAVLGLAVVHGWGPIAGIDDRGSPARDWAVQEPWLRHPLRWVELAFGTVGMIVLTTIVSVAMLAKKHRRAAFFAIGVMIVTSLITSTL
jgi:hypothetical protein